MTMKCLMNGCDLILEFNGGERKRVHGDLWKADNQLVFLGNWDAESMDPRWIKEGEAYTKLEVILHEHKHFWERRGIWVFATDQPEWSPEASDYLLKWGGPG